MKVRRWVFSIEGSDPSNIEPYLIGINIRKLFSKYIKSVWIVAICSIYATFTLFLELVLEQHDDKKTKITRTRRLNARTGK